VTLERWSRGARTGKLSAFLLQAPSAFLLQGLQSECSLLSKPEITGLQRRGKRLQRLESSKHPLKRQLCCKHAPSSPSLARNPLLPLWLRRAAQRQRGGFSRGLGREDLDERYPSGPDTGGGGAHPILHEGRSAHSWRQSSCKLVLGHQAQLGALALHLALNLQSLTNGAQLTKPYNLQLTTYKGLQLTKPYRWRSTYKALQTTYQGFTLQRLTNGAQLACNRRLATSVVSECCNLGT